MTIRRLQDVEQGAEERLSMLTPQLALPSKGPQSSAEMETKNSVAIFEVMAAGSKNLKITFAQGLKDAAQELKVSLECFIERNKYLEEKNARLEATNRRLEEANRQMEAGWQRLKRGMPECGLSSGFLRLPLQSLLTNRVPPYTRK
ncbi:unnamed protein product [Euphydryas editha]|uniref:Uncharacterized protein n=1 Tax=Euphydryas editha TaxID=104508 RepID=A0AAU9UK10_EUPED|nr:unnamed protein product [Euphydryas editha]